MMFQSYALFPHLSIWDNIAFGLRRDKNMTKDMISDRVNEMLRLTRLGKFAKRKPHQISGGQRQRVALARSLAKSPKLLLLDEPLGALDKKLRQDTQFELMDIQESTGTTFVIVTHDQEEAMTVASRVAVMDEGKMMQVDTPARIYEQPNSVYVADFIGEVNIVEGRIASTSDAIEIEWAEGQPSITGQSDQAFSKGDKVHFTIRPEKVSISEDKPQDTPNAIQGKILDIAYLGNVSTYHVEIAGGTIVKAQVANTRRLSRRTFTWDDRVWLSFTTTGGLLLRD
jgi:putrescine transport system ATP-binding protein